MPAIPQRWAWVVVAVAVSLTPDWSWAKTAHGSQVEDLPGVNATGNLMGGMGFSSPVTIRWTANFKTGKFTGHGTGMVTNQSGVAHTFTDDLTIMITGTSVTGIHSTYTVKANGHCTVKVTAAILPICVDPADKEKDRAGTGPNAVIGSIAAGRDAVPAQKQCLESVGRLAGSAMLSTDR